MISLQELRNKFFFVPAYILASKDAHNGNLCSGGRGVAGWKRPWKGDANTREIFLYIPFGTVWVDDFPNFQVKGGFDMDMFPGGYKNKQPNVQIALKTPRNTTEITGCGEVLPFLP